MTKLRGDHVVSVITMDRTMYGKLTPGTYQPYRLAKKNHPAPGYALLADLHRTVSHADGGLKVDGDVSSPNSSGYGSISHSTLTSRPAHGGGSSQKVIRTTEKIMTEKSCNNNNLSELDTLLQDLNNARYSGGLSERVIQTTQVTNTCTKPPGKSHVNGLQETRPSVNSLLEELSTVVDYDNSPSQTSKYGTQPSASSATKELDDLMASLSGFNIPGMVSTPATTTIQRTDHTIIDSAYAKPFKVVKSEPSEKGKQLDCMLGNLHADMSKQGVNTTQKGCCCACNKPIVGEVVTALGKTWHMEHFTCSHCGEELGKKQFFERDGVPYCEDDYHKLFSPRCAYCNGAILDKCVTALDKTWHPDHFFCARCGKPFGDDGFHEKDGKPYCREDFFQMFAPRCGGCNRPIMDNYISALNAQWHPECFVCRDCQQPFSSGSFFDHEGLPYCETHYHAKRGSLCAGCHKPITGRCITAMYRKFHPEHFVCSFCLKQLNKGTFKEQNDKSYCHDCFEKLFG